MVWQCIQMGNAMKTNYEQLTPSNKWYLLATNHWWWPTPHIRFNAQFETMDKQQKWDNKWRFAQGIHMSHHYNVEYITYAYLAPAFA